MRPATAISVTGITLVMIWSVSADCCVLGFRHYQLGQEFTVAVEPLDGKHFKGTVVELSGSDEGLYGVDLKVKTDDKGQVEFRGVKAGDYMLSTDRNGVGGDMVELHVKQHGGHKIKLKWPDTRISDVDSVAGSFMRAAVPSVPKLDKDTPLQGVRLRLTELFSGREVGNTLTDDRGDFAFPGTERGLYALNITWGGESDYILLNVAGTTNRSSPSKFFINPTDCGLGAYQQ